MKNTVDKQEAPSIRRTFSSPPTHEAPYWEDNRSKFFSDSRLVAAIQRSVSPYSVKGMLPPSPAKKTKAPAPLQRKSSSTVIQRFPSHRDLQVADGVITARELLEILEMVAQEEYARIQGRATTDWFGQFARLPDPQPYAFPPAQDGLSYDHSAVNKTFQIGGIRLVNLTPNNYIHAEGNPAGHDITSYPKLSDVIETEEANIQNLSPAGQQARASQIRRYLAEPLTWLPNSQPLPGPTPGLDTHLAVATAALFGAETSRSHRAYISNMMLLDRLETQQPYGRTGTKRLTIPKLLNSRAFPGLTNEQFWNDKINALTTKHPGLAQTLTDATNRPLNQLPKTRALHGGKAPMSGQWSRNMGKAPLPQTDQAPLNLVQAKEINVLIHWLRLQLGLDVLAHMKKSTALRWIKTLVQERIRNFYLMNGKARQFYFLSRLRSSMPGRYLFMQQFMIPMLHQLPFSGHLPGRTFAPSFNLSPRTKRLSPRGGMRLLTLQGPLFGRSFGGEDRKMLVAPSPRMAPNLQIVQGWINRMSQFAGAPLFFHLTEGNSLLEQIRQNWNQLKPLYRKAALHTHPDKRPDKDDTQFKELQRIWENLKEIEEGKFSSKSFALEDQERKALL